MVERGSAIVIATPVDVGHVRPLMPLAKRLVERGMHVVWAISGDESSPPSVWREPLGKLGVCFVDVDATAPFRRERTADFGAVASITQLLRRIAGRANDVAAGAAEAIRGAAADRPIAHGVYDYFAVWGYVAMRRLGVSGIDVVVSAFPDSLTRFPLDAGADDEVYRRELAALRAAGAGSFDAPPRGGMIPDDPGLRVLSFSSPRLSTGAPSFVRLLGVQQDALPHGEDLASLPEAQQALVERLRRVRAEGARVLLLSMGTVVTRMFTRRGPEPLAFLKRLYSTLAASALRAGAFVIASTCDSSAAELGVDEAALGPAARDRVLAMPFVPQPLLFAHGLVDVMLMHGGANTFHEAVVSGVPLLICPGFGDQESVARAAAKLGVGVSLESITHPELEGAITIDDAAKGVLPEMLAPGVSRWKTAATELAALVKQEDGLDAAEALVLGAR